MLGSVWRLGVKKIAGRAFLGAGLQRRLLRDTGVIVAFHRVTDDLAEDGLTCPVGLFEDYCRLFARHFRVVPLEALLDGLEAGRPFRGELAITFDDGYLDNYECAAPVLEAHDLPATFFIATGFIGTQRVAAWDRALPRPAPWMRWDQVRDLRDRGFSIGAHTRSHAHLGEVEGEEARDELEGARSDIAQELGKAPTLFAYPYGQPQHMSAANLERVRAAGFRCSLSCFGGVVSGGADPFQLRRIGMGAWQGPGSHWLFAFDLALGRTLSRSSP